MKTANHTAPTFFVLASCFLTAAATPAPAAVIVNAFETGGGVVVSGGGTLNITDLSFEGENSIIGSILPGSGHVVLGPSPASAVATDWYGIGELSTPGGFGSSFSEVTGDSGSGDRLGIFNPTSPGPLVAVPVGYVSGDPLAAALTFTGTDFATLGMSKGTYVWSWGSGGNADSLTLNVIPEPASAVLLALGGLTLVARRRSFRR